MINDELIIESLLFVLSQPLKQSDLKKVFDNGNTPSLDNIVEKLNRKYKDNAFQISKILPNKKLILSNAGLEVLAIIAYKQPINRLEIESIRGVDCKGVIKNLLTKKLIKIKGRDDSPGRALLYCTTEEYLKHFGLENLSDMPKHNEISEIVDSQEDKISSEII